MLNKKELEKYNRQLILPEVGSEGQLKIKSLKVLVVGAGGLGCPVLQYLVAAGVGKIGIADGDIINMSNLQRQVLYSEQEIGMKKASVAYDKLQRMNPDTVFEVYDVFLTRDNAGEIVKGYDVIVGATDNFESRYLIDQLSQSYNIPFVHGSVEGFQGQYTVFNYRGGVSYSDVFPEKNEEAEGEVIGVVGAMPGIIGSFMAMEVIKVACNPENVAFDGLYLYHALENKLSKLGYGV